MRRTHARAILFASALFGSSSIAFAQAPTAAPTSTANPATQGHGAIVVATTPGAPTPEAPPPTSRCGNTTGDGLHAYEAALLQRRLGAHDAISLDYVRARLAEAEDLSRVGRVDEAIAKLIELVEHPTFDPFVTNEEGRAAIYALGDALATAGAYAPARSYLRCVLAQPNAWDNGGTYARRAVRRIVEVALESDALAQGLDDLKTLPSAGNALSEETRGEVNYLKGRAHEAASDPEAALISYAEVTPRSRFWSQATYLRGLIEVERGNLKDAENLFCKVADPKRVGHTTPVFADQNFFAIRDLARLALGRVAHEEGRFDDARYYYYLVPRDSDRLAEALYEAATTRYEKKDYDGARELLDELKSLQIHHRYEDEAWILDAYIDLARCKFEDADKKLLEFVRRYEPVRDASRKIASSDRAILQLLAAARTGSDAGGADVGGIASPESVRAIAALLRLDPAYARAARRTAVLEHEASGLKLAGAAIDDMQRALATNGGTRAQVAEARDSAERLAEARAALDGVKQQLREVEAGGNAASLAELRQEMSALEARVSQAANAPPMSAAENAQKGADLPDLLRADSTQSSQLGNAVANARKDNDAIQNLLAKDTVRRLDLRLSRLLRRARLGRIESVLGRKRTLEVEIEAINNGILPKGAFDSLDVARYLQDNEEYWPFEGDDWPDEFVGSEGLK